MSKSHRLFDLLQLLRRHRQPVAGQQLASESGVSLRTIRRDIATLQALGADIQGEPGLGYILTPGFLLPPLMFSSEEIEALALGIQWVSRQTDLGLVTAAQNALAKIDAVLPAETRNKLGDHGFHVGELPPSVSVIDLPGLRKAMREQRKVRLSYTDFTGSTTRRVVWPISMGFIESRRFIACWCELRQDYRTFRIDRIAELKLLDDYYLPRRRELVQRWRALVAEEGREGT